MREELNGVTIALAPEEGEKIVLSPEEAAAVVERFPEVEREARKWRAMAGRGELILINEALIARIQTFLAAGRSE